MSIRLTVSYIEIESSSDDEMRALSFRFGENKGAPPLGAW